MNDYTWMVSSIKMRSSGGSKFWYIFVDEATGLKQSIFTPTKSNLAISGLQFLKKLRNKGIDVKNIRCDNAGENKKLEEKVIDENMKINFEYTSAGTPQQNGVAERAFATLYGRVRAMLNRAGFKGAMREKLWAECAMTATFLDGILSNKVGAKSKWEKFYKETPRFADKLRTFGEVGVVWDYRNQKIKKKLDNKGEIHYFVGYSTSHAGDTYRMYNPKTGGITVTRDIYWLNKMPNEVKIKKIEKIESDDEADYEAENEKVQETENENIRETETS